MPGNASCKSEGLYGNAMREFGIRHCLQKDRRVWTGFMKDRLMSMWDKVMLRKRRIMECVNGLLREQAGGSACARGRISTTDPS